MNFNKHSNLQGLHAFLGASKYSWLNYDDERLKVAWRNSLAAKHGTEMHDLAARCIRLNQRLPRTDKTINMYVNDAIGYKMTPEQPLYYSENCFGTCDAISFRKNQLRIHDYKSGTTPAHMEQLEIYAALFLLEYEKIFGVSPKNTKVNLRIYQNDDVIEDTPDADRLEELMLDIREKSQWVEEFRSEVD